MGVVDLKNKQPLFEIQRICAILMTLLYFCVYLYALEPFDHYALDIMSEEEDWFSKNMEYNIVFLGWGLSLAALCFGVTYLKDRLKSCIINIIAIVNQLFYHTRWINAVRKSTFPKVGNNEEGIECCIRMQSAALLLIICLMAFLAVNTIVFIMIKKEQLPRIYNTEMNKMKKKKINYLHYINWLMIFVSVVITLMYLTQACGKELNDINIYSVLNMLDKWHFVYGINGIIIPFVLVFGIVGYRFIREEKYLCVVGGYILYALSIKNIMYHFCVCQFDYYNYGIWNIYDAGIVYVKLIIILFVIVTICKYLKKLCI